MMIALTAIEAGAAIVLHAQSPPIRENSRRLSRSATLDGGCVISDGGMSDGDRDFDFAAAQVPPATLDAMWAFAHNESLVHLSCAEGVFSGYVEQVKIEAADVSFRFMVYEKLT